MKKSRPPGITPYDHPAGGWDALRAVAKTLAHQQIVAQGSRTLLKANQPDGFDCPGCAWPDPKHTSSFEFCENGAKAITWESTSKRTDSSFFAQHTVSELWSWTDHALEDAGRLTLPLLYDPASDRFEPIEWNAAFELIASGLNKLESPDQAEFYTSGRASNEAAFLYQLFVRAFGTNNFPDCSNMCHEATSVGLPKSIGVGKGTVTLEDFDHADAIFSFGHSGVFGRRDVVFMNVEDLAHRGLQDGDKIDVLGLFGGQDDRRLARGYTAVAYDLPRGSIAGYYPEMNVVMSLHHYDRESGTQSYKGIPVRIAATSS